MKKKLYTYKELHNDWMKEPKFREAYEKLQPEMELAKAIIEARIKRKISQEELAKRVGTGQAVISRLEGMRAKPSLSLIQRVADALDLKAEIHLVPKEA